MAKDTREQGHSADLSKGKSRMGKMRFPSVGVAETEYQISNFKDCRHKEAPPLPLSDDLKGWAVLYRSRWPQSCIVVELQALKHLTWFDGSYYLVNNDGRQQVLA